MFSDDDEYKFLDHREYSGSILKVLREVEQYINLTNKRPSMIVGLERIEKRDYRPEIIREGLINALLHRDYANSGAVLVKIYSNRIEILSLGGLVYGITKEDIAMGMSKTRNPKLASILFRLNIIEAYGTGLSRISKAYSSKSFDDLIAVTDNLFKLTLFNENIIKPLSGEICEMQTLYEYNNKKTHASHIMDFLDIHGFISRSVVEEIAGIGQTRAGIILKQMVEAGTIIKQGKGKNTRYIKGDFKGGV